MVRKQLEHELIAVMRVRRGLMHHKLQQAYQFWSFMARTVAAAKAMRDESEGREGRMNDDYRRMEELVKVGRPPPPDASEMELRFYAQIASELMSERRQGAMGSASRSPPREKRR